MAVNPVPGGYTTVTPWIISRDTAGLLDYLKRAFGAVELGRFCGDDGAVQHAETRIGDAVVMCFDARPEWPPTPAFLRLFVPDADAVHRRAVEAGGTSVTEVTHLAFGDRVGRVRDPFGNLWWIQTHLEDVTEDELGRRMTDPVFTEAMAYVQSAEFFPKAADPASPSPSPSPSLPGR
ncbi:VOC family protein [Streptomyces sp. NBC_01506]|uniref:VOC family protein n=1 Tax=Streptomyces sp. NBC_01506 TaxID=2903887 RepID=UPI00386A7DF1